MTSPVSAPERPGAWYAGAQPPRTPAQGPTPVAVGGGGGARLTAALLAVALAAVLLAVLVALTSVATATPAQRCRLVGGQWLGVAGVCVLSP